MDRKFARSTAVMFVAAVALDFFVHGVLLHGDYERLPNLMRAPTDAHARMPWMLLAHFSIAVAFTWIYLKGREDKPWLPQGLRYGVAVALLTTVPTYLIYHVVSPFPLDLALKQIVLGSLVIIIMAVVLAWLNK